jgi:hypothetical protein
MEKSRKGSSFISFKIINGDQTKRINETLNSLKDLKNRIKSLFDLNNRDFDILIYLKSDEGGKLYINTEKEFESLISKYINQKVSIRLYYDHVYNSIICEDLNSNFNLLSREESYISSIEPLTMSVNEGGSKIISKENVEKIKDIVNQKLSIFEEKLSQIMLQSTLIANDSKFSSNSLPIINQSMAENKSSNNIDNNFIKTHEKNNNSANIDNGEVAIFQISCDICMSYPLAGCKFICFLCDDLTLCQECEKLHNHPCIKFKTSELSTIDDITHLIITNPVCNKNSMKETILRKQSEFTGIKGKLTHMGKHKIRFEMLSNYFLIKPNSEMFIPIIIHNEGLHSFPQDTYIYVKNCEDLYFKTDNIKKLLRPKEKMPFDLLCKTGSRLKEYQMEIHCYEKDTLIEYEPYIFIIKVCRDIYEEEVDEQKSIYSYNPEDTVSTLPQFKKEVLSDVIRRDLSSKDIIEICKILDKYQWKLTEEAIQEIK